jgi:predicted secreted protein
MPKSRANPGFGVKFKIGDGNSPEVFTEIAEIVDVPGIGTTHRTDEVTHMSSPGGWAEYIGLGVKEAKAFTLAMNFVADDPDQISLYQTRVESGAKHNYQIEFTDDDLTTLTFEAIIADTDISHARDSKADLSVQVQPSGGYEWGSGT